MKVGVIRCMQTEDFCPGTGDFRAIQNRTGMFQDVKDETADRKRFGRSGENSRLYALKNLPGENFFFTRIFFPPEKRSKRKCIF